jgi:hypothetical protein
MPTPVKEEFAIGDARILILWKNVGTCEADVSSRYGRGKEFLPVRPIEKVTITAGDKTSQIIGCSALSADQKCQACIITSEVNPTYITLIIGGRPYQICVANCP